MDKVSLTNGGFRKITEDFVNERQKRSIFKIVKQNGLAVFEKKITVESEKDCILK